MACIYILVCIPPPSHSLPPTLSLPSVATMDQCVCQFMRATGCTKSQALQAASLHPATVLRLPHRGTLEPGMAADLVILDQEMNVQATCIAGEPVWTLPGSRLHRESLAQLEQAMQI